MEYSALKQFKYWKVFVNLNHFRASMKIVNKSVFFYIHVFTLLKKSRNPNLIFLVLLESARLCSEGKKKLSLKDIILIVQLDLIQIKEL